MEDIYVAGGIMDQIKSPDPPQITVEFLYETIREDFWWLLDILLEDRKDLQERIEKYKRTHKGS